MRRVNPPISASPVSKQAMSELAFSSMEPHLRVLRASGSYHLDRASTPPWRYRLHRVYMGFVIFLPYLYVAQELAYVYTVRGNPDQVIYGLFKLFSYIDFIYKKMVLLLKADRVENLLNTMKGPLFNQEGLHHREILLTQVASAKSTLYIFNFMGNLSCLVWLLVPIVQYSRGHEIRFPLLFPVEINKAPNFYIIMVYLSVQWVNHAYINSTLDVFMSCLLGQCTAQIRILRLDLETAVARSHEKARQESISFSEAFHKVFTVSLLHHKEIVRMAVNIEDIFGGAMFCQIVVTGWIFCTTAYRAVDMNPASVEFCSMITYITCVMVELVLYCLFGNRLAIESDKIPNSAYSMDWLQLPVTHRKSLFIFLERVRTPIQVVAGYIIPLSASTLVQVLKSSYTFYAVLNKSKEI
ncbi:unnamed protein product [Plutella xylostella]|uniref:Odorant receptor n=1 Tax=Plutella xylostella TaxID=51655 RepID=A0A8S4G6W2_PLUXY|nr:unnamed protein product [Plutella xylostella]